MGNVWLIAATTARAVVAAEGGSEDAPHILKLNAAGELCAVGPLDPHYAREVVHPDMVCTITPSMPVDRLAAKLRAAAAKRR